MAKQSFGSEQECVVLPAITQGQLTEPADHE